jgi:hypothetical protein
MPRLKLYRRLTTNSPRRPGLRNLTRCSPAELTRFESPRPFHVKLARVQSARASVRLRLRLRLKQAECSSPLPATPAVSPPPRARDGLHSSTRLASSPRGRRPSHAGRTTAGRTKSLPTAISRLARRLPFSKDARQVQKDSLFIADPRWRPRHPLLLLTARTT